MRQCQPKWPLLLNCTAALNGRQWNQSRLAARYYPLKTGREFMASPPFADAPSDRICWASHPGNGAGSPSGGKIWHRGSIGTDGLDGGRDAPRDWLGCLGRRVASQRDTANALRSALLFRGLAIDRRSKRFDGV